MTEAIVVCEGKTEAAFVREKAKAVERAFHAEVVRETNCRPERVLPRSLPSEALSRRPGLDRIRAGRRHFDRWIAHGETLADGAPPCPH